MSIIVRGKYLYLDFCFFLPDGTRIRSRESTGLADIPQHRKDLEIKLNAINYSLKVGTFKYLDWFPHGSKAKYFRAPNRNISLIAFWQKWQAEKSIRVNTIKNLNTIYQKYIYPYFGNQEIKETTNSNLLEFRNYLLTKNLTPIYVNNIMGSVKEMLRAAYSRGFLTCDITEGIKMLKTLPADIEPFSFEELNYLLEFIKTKAPFHYNMFLIWSRTGLRPGELIALRWENIDFFNRKILIRGTLHKWGVGQPKTQNSIREINITDEILTALTSQKCQTWLMKTFVFLNNGLPFDLKTLNCLIRDYCLRAGIKPRTAKNMRHTFATLHIAAGENITWVSKTLGHGSVYMTLNKYNRFIPNLTQQDGTRFDKIIHEATMEVKSESNLQ